VQRRRRRRHCRVITTSNPRPVTPSLACFFVWRLLFLNLMMVCESLRHYC
jgi:hypothetical protein